jgi:hypothetical protein
VIYWIAGKILGYGKVTLVRVPIYLQYKLLLADIFPNIQVDSDVENKEQSVNVIEKNMEQPFDELNLILMQSKAMKVGPIKVIFVLRAAFNSKFLNKNTFKKV